jgi:hypothetical protein
MQPSSLNTIGKIKILTDVPFNSENGDQNEDALNFGRYSETISDIIMNSDPRFAVGIFGGWGTGKTTLMHMIKNRLDRNDNIVTIWFEAWRYERENNLAVVPFLRTFKISLNKITESEKRDWVTVIKEGITKSTKAFKNATKVSIQVPGFVTVETDIKSKNTDPSDTILGKDEDMIYYHGTGFLQEALQLVRKSDKSRRIVVFIDDLDRCFPEKALEVLESVKSLFDIEGMVFVIGMDSNSIDTYVKNKYGQNTSIKGIDYLQKIVQLPSQVPTWKEGWSDRDVMNSIERIISTELMGYPILDELKNNLTLIFRGVQLNPREIKRFVNSIILAASVFSSDNKNLSIKELVTVQALSFRLDWKNFLEIVSPDDNRQILFRHYFKFEDIYLRKGILLPSLQDLSSETSEKGINFFKTINEIYDTLVAQDELGSSESDRINRYRNELRDFYSEYIKLGEDLKLFLESGAADVLRDLKKMHVYRRALEATKHPSGLNFELMDSCWRDPEKDAKLGKKMYQFHVIINAPNSVLDQIETVTYKLPPSWKSRSIQIKDIKDRDTNFKLKDLAWGSFTLNVEVKFRGQDSLVTKSHRISLREESPRLPV